MIDAGGARRANIVIEGERIVALTGDVPSNAHVVDYSGRYIIPMMVNAHGHLGLLEGTSTQSANFTETNIERQLIRYRDYGVAAVLSMGTDHDNIFPLSARHPEGARIFTAGLGFGVPGGMPPLAAGIDHVYRPESAAEARAQVRALASLAPDVVKIWVDDFWGQFPKMKPEIYAAIIDEAHTQGLRVAAHVYHLEDARLLVALGIDMLVHSVRDAAVDPAFLDAMKRGNVAYVPTLSIDEFAIAYADVPAWLNDPFFKAALEPGVFDMITSDAYKDKVRKDPRTRAEAEAFPTALANLAKIYRAGIFVAMGTDSGAHPLRAQGFSEHHELMLLVRAGLTPLEALTVATKNSAELLKAHDLGTLAPGKEASFLVLTKSPLDDIANTQSIEAVFHRGQRSGTSPSAPAL